MTARTYFVTKSGSDLRLFLTGLIISTACHILIFAGLIFAPGLNFTQNLQPTPINVSLVSMPANYYSPPEKKQPKTLPNQTKKAEKKSPAKVSTAAKTTMEKPAKKEFKPKTSLKKKTFKTGKVMENAIKEIEKKVETNKPDPITQALEKIKEKVASSPPEKAKGERQYDTEEEMSEGAGGEGSRSFSELDLYLVRIRVRIQNNWAFSEQLAGRHEKLESSLIITIMANGKIKDVYFEKKSGNSHLDESARKAILKSDPLPPLPPEIGRPSLTVGMNFTPSGIQ